MTGKKFNTKTAAGREEMEKYFADLEKRIWGKDEQKVFIIDGVRCIANSPEEAQVIYRMVPTNFQEQARRADSEIKCQSTGSAALQ